MHDGDSIVKPRDITFILLAMIFNSSVILPISMFLHIEKNVDIMIIVLSIILINILFYLADRCVNNRK